MSGRYDFAVSPDSTYGRAARMIERHAGPGLVVDLGCSYGRVAEVIAGGGRRYVGIDVDTEALSSLDERGHETHRLDVSAEDLAPRLAEMIADRPVGAVLALDVIEHLPDPSALLGRLGELSELWGDPLLVTSVPNVAHGDLAAKLLAGRWDPTELGLLDRTHLSLFTERRMLDELATQGFACIDAEDVIAEAAEQHFPPRHPYLARGTPLHDLVTWLRSLPDPTGSTYQFVRALRRSPSTPPPASAAAATSSATLTVIVAEGGPRPTVDGLEDTLVCLAAQETEDFEVIIPVPPGEVDAVGDLVHGFGPSFRDRVQLLASEEASAPGRLNAALDQARSPLLGFVRSGDVLTPDWAGVFIEAGADHPGAVLRVRSYQRRVGQMDGAALSQTKAVPTSDERFQLWRHLRADQLPVGSFALPSALCRHAGLRFDETTTAATWKFSLVAAMLAGVADLPANTCVHQRRPGDADQGGADLVEALASTPVVFPPGSAGLLQGAGCEQDQAVALARERQDLLGRLATTERNLEEAERRYQEIRTSEFWRASAPFRRGVTWLKSRRRPSA